MMELPVQLSRVKVQDKLLQLSRDTERVDTYVTYSISMFHYCRPVAAGNHDKLHSGYTKDSLAP